MAHLLTAALQRRIRFALATSGRFERAVMGVGPLREGAAARARRYVGPDGVEPTLELAASLADAGFAVHLDRFGEFVDDPGKARVVGDAYVTLAEWLGELQGTVHLALDPSNLGLDAAPGLFGEQLDRIAAALPAGREITVGAEDAARTDAALAEVIAAAGRGVPLRMTVQANLRRSIADVDRLAAAGVPIRLVKGAYLEPPGTAHPHGPATDAAFASLALRLARSGTDVRIATHDPDLRERLLSAGAAPSGVEMLLGVRGRDAVALRDRGVPVGLYVPFGPHWFRYLMRRRAEAVGA